MVEMVTGLLVFVPYLQRYACLHTCDNGVLLLVIGNRQTVQVSDDGKAWTWTQFIRTGEGWRLAGSVPYRIADVYKVCIPRRLSP